VVERVDGDLLGAPAQTGGTPMSSAGSVTSSAVHTSPKNSAAAALPWMPSAPISPRAVPQQVP
jgi:hypothetical protein